METFTKGDVVLFPFPYTDLTNRKVRPCLVISNEFNNDIILCQITSKNIKKDQNCIELKKDETIGGSLIIDSFIRCNMIFTASKKQILKKFCKISKAKYFDVISKIIKIIS
ncbi:MAG: type II toxin-antitoxin system PemK/MazF family toxin [Nanoarchaeota archaeon]